MKTYKDYINEGAYEDEVRNVKASKLYPEFLNLYGEIKRFADTCFNRYSFSDIEEKMMDGKDVNQDLKKYDSVVKSLMDISKNFENTRYSKSVQEAKDLIKKYYEAIEGYKKSWDVYKQMFSYLKVGEPIDRSIPKISEMTRKIKNYDRVGKKYTGLFFDDYSKDELMSQIKDYNGTVKLAGVSDLYIQYRNGKLARYYF